MYYASSLWVTQSMMCFASGNTVRDLSSLRVTQSTMCLHSQWRPQFMTCLLRDWHNFWCVFSVSDTVLDVSSLRETQSTMWLLSQWRHNLWRVFYVTDTIHDAFFCGWHNLRRVFLWVTRFIMRVSVHDTIYDVSLWVTQFRTHQIWRRHRLGYVIISTSLQFQALSPERQQLTVGYLEQWHRLE